MANVIDTLIVKLGLDNSDFQEKIKDAEKNTKNLEKTTDDLTDSLRGAATAGTFLGNVLFKAMDFTVQTVSRAIISYEGLIENLRQVSRTTNQSIEDFQRWSYAIEYSGGNVAAFQSTFESLSKQIRQSPFTHNSTFLRGLSELGISVHSANGQIKSMSDLLLGLSGRLGGMSEGKAFLIGQRLGLDDDTIRLLREGKDAVQSYLDKTKEDGIIQKQNLEIYERLRKARVELSKSWSELSIKIGNVILPIITKLVDGLTSVAEWISENSGFIQHTLELLGWLASGIAGVTLAIGLLVNSLKLLKMGLWGLGIGAIILLWDDFMTYLEGGDSVIGRVINKFNEWGKSIKENLRPVLEWLKDFWDGFVEFFEEKILWCIELWDKLANKVRGIKNWFTGNDTASNVGSMQGNTSRVISDTINNSTSNYDFRGSSIITRATNGQDFQSLIGSEIQNSIGGIS